MHILLLGATGNLGLRLLPALLAHGHTVVAYIRSEPKLRGLVSARLCDRITIHVGDALDTAAVEAALRRHGCDGVVNTAGNFAPPWKGQYLGRIATSVSGAAVRVGRERGRPLRAWFIGGVTSLVYPFDGNVRGWKVQDYMPASGTAHHRGTEKALKGVVAEELEWSLLCVAWMTPVKREIDVLDKGPRGNGLVVEVGRLPEWEGSWLGSLPVVGRTLDLFWHLGTYSTRLEDVADLIAEDLASGRKQMVSCLVGMKDRSQGKSKNA